MKEENFSGIKGVLVQDHAVVETQGRITDRTKEHLGTSDIAIVAWRRIMLRAAKALRDRSELPAMLTTPGLPWSELKGQEVILPEGENWQQAAPLDRRFAV